MPKSKSKSSARAAHSGGCCAHPAMKSPSPFVKARMGSLDPFRLPDEFNHPTAAAVLPDEWTVTSNAQGNAVFGTSPILSRISGTLDAAGTVTAIGFTDEIRTASFKASARLARQIFQRVSVTYIGAADTAAGYLSGMHKSTQTDFNTAAIGALHHGSDVQGKAVDGITIFTSNLQNSSLTDPTLATFMQDIVPWTVCVASGLPVSTPVFRVRVWRWMEFTAKEGDLWEGGEAFEPHDPAALAVHSNLSTSATSFFGSHTIEAASGLIKGAANAAYHIAQPIMSQYAATAARNYLSGLAYDAGMLMLTA